MTQAQKTAKEKFKKAIAYRQKTGVSLKEAFAHVYGKKISNTRKLVFDYLEVPKGKKPKLVKVIGKTPKNKIAKKVAVKKKAVKKVARPSRSTKKVKATYKVNYQTGNKNRTARGTNQDSKRKALAPGKRTSASGNTYYETRANRSDFSRKAMTGIGKILTKAQELKNLTHLGVGPLYKKVISVLKNKAKDYSSVKVLMNEILDNGLQSGVINELIYYKDTLAFYKKYQSEITGLLKEAMYSSGIDSPEGLFGSKWDRTDPFAQETNNRNLLAWFGFEESVRHFDNILY
jgi:hypothetical protein